MQMALDATSAHDPESQAWHHAQLGDLHFSSDTSPTPSASIATRCSRSRIIRSPSPAWRASTRRAATSPAALAGYAKLQASAAMPEYAARMAEIEQALGRPADAARHFALAEQGWRSDMPEPAHLARLLARDAGTRRRSAGGRRAGGGGRQDIFTMDAVAWAAFRAGRHGTRRRGVAPGAADRAPAIAPSCIMRRRLRRRRGIEPGRGTLVTRALDGHPTFDVVLAPEAQALLRVALSDAAASRPPALHADHARCADESPASHTDPVALARRRPRRRRARSRRRPRRPRARTTCASPTPR